VSTPEHLDLKPDHPDYVPRGRRMNCPAQGWRGYECTLDAGHEGPHAAHGSDGILYIRWPQKAEP